MKNKKKGFTLVELIIVIAVIGILTAILVPSWMNYIRSARLKTQNNNARVIFNAAQTISQDYKFSERKLEDANKIIGKNVDFYFYWDGENGEIVNADGSDIGTKSASQIAFEREFSRKINNIYDDSDNTVYKIYVENYLVQSVVSARSESDPYYGSYPEKQEDRQTTGSSVKTFDMTTVELP